jgi:hypothetical protein
MQVIDTEYVLSVNRAGILRNPKVESRSKTMEFIPARNKMERMFELLI